MRSAAPSGGRPARAAARAPAALLLAAAAVLAGCTSLPLGGGVFTALEAHGQAEPRAKAWRSDAALLSVVAPEAGPDSPFLGRGQDGWPGEVRADGNVGDGRLPQWFLVYLSASANRTLGVAVHADGRVAAEEQEPDDDPSEVLPLGSWDVDSPRAADVAMAEPDFRAAARAPDGGVVYALARPRDAPGGGPVWVLTAGSEQAQAGAVVLVDARTGGRIAAPSIGGFPFGGLFGRDTRDDGPPACRREVTTFGGSVGLAQPEATHTFEVAAGCAAINVTLTWSATLPTDRAALVLTGPGGEDVAPAEETTNSDPQGGTFTAVYPVAAPGGHTATVRLASDLPQGAGADYTLDVAVGP